MAASRAGLHLDTPCAPAVTWQLQEAGPKARSANRMCPRFQGNPGMLVSDSIGYRQRPHCPLEDGSQRAVPSKIGRGI